MRKNLFLFILLCFKKALQAQTPSIYTITADSVKITNDCDTAELIIENHTQNVSGFLFNKGCGRTEFRRAVKLNDSTLLLGTDTIVIVGNILANNGLSVLDRRVQLGQAEGTAGNPAALISNREIPLNGKNQLLTGSVYVGIGTALPGTRLQVTSPSGSPVVFANYASGQATITLPTGTPDREITIKNLHTSNLVIVSGLDTNESNSIATSGAITVKYTGGSWVDICKY